jgi:hypothetical protein
VRLDAGDAEVDRGLVERARQLAGLKGYATNLPESTMDGAAVVAAHHDLWQVEKSFRMARSEDVCRDSTSTSGAHGRTARRWCGREPRTGRRLSYGRRNAAILARQRRSSARSTIVASPAQPACNALSSMYGTTPSPPGRPGGTGVPGMTGGSSGWRSATTFAFNRCSKVSASESCLARRATACTCEHRRVNAFARRSRAVFSAHSMSCTGPAYGRGHGNCRSHCRSELS